MKQRTYISILFLACAMLASAIPVQRGYKKMITLIDGTAVEAELRGDEYGSYWETADGNCYFRFGGDEYYTLVNKDAVQKKANGRRMKANAHRIQRMNKARRGKIGGDHDPYIGMKKGLVILVTYPNKQFYGLDTPAFFKRVMNTRHLAENGTSYTRRIGFKGSVKDYFSDQSNGLFELDFDVVGPYQLSHEYAYYGAHTADGKNDSRVGTMIYEALTLADPDVDYRDYDWDGDGEVEQVYVMYAGLGEAAGGDEDTVWPHEHTLMASYGNPYFSKEDGNVKLNTYACGSELSKFGRLQNTERVDGIGTICHEFSHCLGLPDMYDTHNDRNGFFGMGYWDLMCAGSYNGESLVPPNFSAYEKIYSGWVTPIVLDKPTTLRNLQPQGKAYGQVFVIYNDQHPDEYYLLENRQQSGNVWDSQIASSGLMIQYVDFNADIWEYNNLNSNYKFSDDYGDSWAYIDNDHERCTIFHADGTDGVYDEEGDLYPYNGNNSLTDTSSPAAILRNGSQFMGKPITNITQNADGTISFDFMGGSETNIVDGIEEVFTGADDYVGQTQVFDLQGRAIYTAPTQTFDIHDVPARGVLVVKKGTKSYKILR